MFKDCKDQTDSVGSCEDVFQVQSTTGVVHVGRVREVSAEKLAMMLMAKQKTDGH